MSAKKLFNEAKTYHHRFNTRRHFLSQCKTGMGLMGLGSLMDSCNLFGGDVTEQVNSKNPLQPKAPHFQGKAKSVIFLHMAGAPSQLEMFDYKPELQKMDGLDCPARLVRLPAMH
jgi:hypothetical protein